MSRTTWRIRTAIGVGMALMLTACGGGAFDDRVDATSGGAAPVDLGPRTPDRGDPRVRLHERVADGQAAGLLEGSSSADLVYTPITPCRIVDTRVGTAIDGDMAANETRDFYVTDFDTPQDTSAAFASQGGNTNGCGLLYGLATSVMVNFTAVGAQGSGYLRAWAPGTSMPNATLLNYNQTLNVSNGIAVPICDPYQIACDTELNIKTFSARTHLVVEVVGYFSFSLPPGALTPETTSVSADINVASTPAVCTGFANALSAQELHPFWAGRIQVDGQVTLSITHANGVEDRVNVTVGYDKTVDSVDLATSGCGQSPCTAGTGSPAVVSSAEASGTYSVTVPLRCEIVVTFGDIDLGNELVYRLYVNGLHSSGGAATADRLSYTSTFTADWAAA